MPNPRIIAALLASACLCSCGASSSKLPGAGRDTAYVGAGRGLTNPEPGYLEGMQLAFDQLNQRRPASAPVLALRVAPPSADSPVKVAIAFRDDPSVVAVVGHTESDATIAAAPIYADREHGGRNPMLAVTTSSALAVTRVSPWIYRINANVAEQGRALARFVADSLGLRSTGVLYRNDVMGKGFLRAFTEEFTRKGGVVLERDPFSEQIHDFGAYAKRLVDQKAPSVVISGNPPQIRSMIRALHEAGGSPAVVSTNGPAVSDTGDFSGLHHLVLFAADRPVSNEGAKFVAAYTAQVGRAPNHWAALSYDAATMIGLAIHDRGADRAAIRDWFAAVGKGHPAHAGATGAIAFDEHRDPVNKTLLVGHVAKGGGR